MEENFVNQGLGKNCSHCGAQHHTPVRFCTNCGERIANDLSRESAAVAPTPPTQIRAEQTEKVVMRNWGIRIPLLLAAVLAFVGVILPGFIYLPLIGGSSVFSLLYNAIFYGSENTAIFIVVLGLFLITPWIVGFTAFQSKKLWNVTGLIFATLEFLVVLYLTIRTFADLYFGSIWNVLETVSYFAGVTLYLFAIGVVSMFILTIIKLFKKNKVK